MVYIIEGLGFLNAFFVRLITLEKNELKARCVGYELQERKVYTILFWEV